MKLGKLHDKVILGNSCSKETQHSKVAVRVFICVGTVSPLLSMNGVSERNVFPATKGGDEL